MLQSILLRSVLLPPPSRAETAKSGQFNAFGANLCGAARVIGTPERKRVEVTCFQCPNWFLARRKGSARDLGGGQSGVNPSPRCWPRGNLRTINWKTYYNKYEKVRCHAVRCAGPPHMCTAAVGGGSGGGLEPPDHLAGRPLPQELTVRQSLRRNELSGRFVWRCIDLWDRLPKCRPGASPTMCQTRWHGFPATTDHF